MKGSYLTKMKYVAIIMIIIIGHSCTTNIGGTTKVQSNKLLSSTNTLTSSLTNIFTPSYTSTMTITPNPSLFHGMPSNQEEKILFIETEGCKVIAITTSGGDANTVSGLDDCYSAYISPDAQKIAYISSQNKSKLFISNIDGSDNHFLVDIPPNEYNAIAKARKVIWLPSGDQIIIETEFLYLDGYRDIYSVSLTGSSEIKHMYIAPIHSRITISPNGKWIFYFGAGALTEYPIIQNTIDPTQYYFIDILDEYQSLDDYYEWSTDSNSLYSIISCNPTYEITEDIVEGQQVIKKYAIDQKEYPISYIQLPLLLETGEEYTGWDARMGLRVSPKGNMFLAMQRKLYKLFLLNQDGSINRLVVKFPVQPISIDWSPNGDWIYFVLKGTTIENQNAFGIIRPDGTDLRILQYGVEANSIIWIINDLQ